ncbi:hypothetical protein WH96_03410 [Kiloniella spongiae]|uniref:Uncharacterized protein n=1 Tax=Kiloniella spongiae TaxID=1489064 RepID=A0A0H2MJF9_9PROT|nr:hypothetical protein [Kiloniella spongiae]KLN62538.1 hypothetical protein WH96_03410 [Kiloniella spongiae]
MFNRFPKSVLMAVSLVLSGCAAGPDSSPNMVFERKGVTVPTLAQYQYCHGYGCSSRLSLTMSETDKRGLIQAFGVAQTAQQERAAMAKAVAYMEQMNAPKAGTENDIGGTFTGYGQPGQLDCEDESANTTTTLIFLQELGLIKHHKLRSQVTRGFFIGGWPHTSAAVVEASTGKSFAIDSWFEKNGVKPHIVPYEMWSSGWDPGKDGPVPAELQ